MSDTGTQQTLFTEAGATIDGAYRYLLWRRWGVNGRRATFVMLNPSTADDLRDDPTIRRCLGFAQREGCHELDVVNLYALRATDPRRLLEVDDPRGPRNVDYLSDALLSPTGPVICAWGGRAQPEDEAAFVRLAREHGTTLSCLGTTLAGSPRHPLYLKATTPLVAYRGPVMEDSSGAVV